MRFLELASARAFLPVQREGARLLHEILSGFDLSPLPDGSVRLTLECAPEFLDRLAVWGASVEDIEDDGDLSQADPDAEPDARNLASQAGDNVIVAVDLIERREIRAAAREQLDLLLAEPREGELPTLEPRPVYLSRRLG